MVRILHIVTTMNRGGLETMLMNYYRHIDKEEIQFDFLTHRQDSFAYEEEIKILGGRIYRVPRLIPWSHYYKKELNNFFQNHPEYSIVHVHQDCLSAIALKIAQRNKIPIRIAHAHNISQEKNYKYIWKWIYMKKIPLYATDLFSCGEEAGKWMFSGKAFVCLKNAIDITKYTYNENTRRQVRDKFRLNDELVVGNVSRFNKQKNHLFLLKIFEQILKVRPDAKLLLVGDGEEKTNICNYAIKTNILNNIIIAGIRNDVNRMLQAMDVFVMPSLFEGLPVSLIEAQAAGLPCVISDTIPGECIKTTRLVSVKKLAEEPDEWAAHILQRAQEGHSNHRQELIDAGFDIVQAAQWLQNFYLKKAEEAGCRH